MWPMSKFSSLVSRARRHLHRRSDTLRLDSCPLHTERPEWAAHAPAQVEAACKRGAHFIGLTETRGATMAECWRIAKAHGYQVFQAHMDAARNVTLLVRGDLKVLDHTDETVFNNHRVGVTVDWHGHPLTVFEMHWESTDKGHQVQSEALIAAMQKASQGKGLSFYMGDSNPRPEQGHPGSQPDTILSQAGMPVIFEELGHFPPGIGVNVIGRNKADGRVKAILADTFPALGSDHIPCVATYKVRRVR